MKHSVVSVIFDRELNGQLSCHELLSFKPNIQIYLHNFLFVFMKIRELLYNPDLNIDKYAFQEVMRYLCSKTPCDFDILERTYDCDNSRVIFNVLHKEDAYYEEVRSLLNNLLIYTSCDVYIFRTRNIMIMPTTGAIICSS